MFIFYFKITVIKTYLFQIFWVCVTYIMHFVQHFWHVVPINPYNEPLTPLKEKNAEIKWPLTRQQ